MGERKQPSSTLTEKRERETNRDVVSAYATWIHGRERKIHAFLSNIINDVILATAPNDPRSTEGSPWPSNCEAFVRWPTTLAVCVLLHRVDTCDTKPDNE